MMTWSLGLLLLAAAEVSTSEVSVRRARNWSETASEGWCAIKVWVDDEAEFALKGDRLKIFTARGREARDVASECSGPLPRNVESFQFRGIDGRGEVRLLEEPASRNGWQAVVRIRDTKPGGEEYHYRLEWGRGSAFARGRGNADVSRMRTRDLRREIEGVAANQRRRLTLDEVDDYIDRVRVDRWSLDDIARDLERRR